MRPRHLLLLALLPTGAACHGASDSKADPVLDGAAEDAAPEDGPAAKDGPPDGNPLGSARPCDPFLPGEPAVTRLSGIIAIGRHRDGTGYLVDKPWSTERVFSSDGPARVYFRREIGSQVASAPASYVFGAARPGPPFLLKVEFFANPRLRMGVIRGTSQARDFAIGSEGDELEVDDSFAPTLAGVEFRDLPTAAGVFYFAQMEDGRQLVVLRPENQTAAETFRLFLGMASAMVERPIEHVAATDSNRAWAIHFVLEGAPAEATVPVMTGPGSLKIAGRTLSLTPLPPDTARREHQYGCL